MVDEKRWAAARAAGLSIVNLGGPGMEDGLSKAENHGTLIPSIADRIDAAKANGIGQVIIFSGNRKGQDDAAGLANCIAACKKLAPKAEKAKVTLVFEMLNSFEHVDYQGDHSAYGFDLVKAVSSPRVKVLYDIYHMHRMGENVLADILGNLEYIAHLHIAGDGRRFPGEKGAIDYRSIVKQVTAAGYKGFWGQEFLAPPDPYPELESAARLFNSYA